MLEERIVAHERPRLIEYVVINEAPIHNHLGRLELTPAGSGTRLDYSIAFDYKPAAAGAGGGGGPASDLGASTAAAAMAALGKP